MRGSRQLAAVVSALMTAFALVLLGAPPSAAGGPTSVLLASSTSERTASLYHTEEAYGRLEKLLAPAGRELDQSREEEPHWGQKWKQEPSDSVTATWMAHDISPWRVDRVFLAVPDSREVWIHTTLTPEDAAASSDPGVWHKAEAPEAVRALLTGLGVTGHPSDSPAQTEPPSTKASEPSPWDRAWWAIPALLLGLALGSGATLLLRHVAARTESGPPRQELIDA
jgi:hypothetical protein